MFFCNCLTPCELQQCLTYTQYHDKSPELSACHTAGKLVRQGQAILKHDLSGRKGEFMMLHFKVPFNTTLLSNKIFTLGKITALCCLIHFFFFQKYGPWELTHIFVTAVYSEQRGTTGAHLKVVENKSDVLQPGLWAQIIAHSGAYGNLRQVYRNLNFQLWCRC